MEQWACFRDAEARDQRSVVPLAVARAAHARRWRSYLWWSGCVAVAFFAVYPTMNWITSVRPGPLHLYLQAELAAPLVPQLIWAYLSMYVLFLVPPLLLPAACMPALGKQLIAGTLLSGIAFLLLPAELGFARAVPTAAPYSGIFAAMFSIDRPYNLVPSLHVLYSAAIALACADVSRPGVRVALHAWLVVIAASTVLVHQHHLLDLAASLVLVFLLRRWITVPHA
jgi:membrane-associated phospholipid phosphatase